MLDSFQAENRSHCGWAGASAGSVVATEQYWTLLEEMRAEYLGDLEEYVGYARMNDRSPQPSDKMNKMLNIVARLSVRSPPLEASLWPLMALSACAWRSPLRVGT